MKNKTWALLALTALLGSFALLSGIVIAIDPFQIYRLAENYIPPLDNTTQVYSNAGVARNYEYDSAVVGTSMTENFKPTQLSRELGGRFIKLSTSAGSSYSHALLLDIAFKTHEMKRVVYALDIYSLIEEPDVAGGAKLPMYLYDDLLFNDVQYWLNRSVLASFIPRCLKTWGQTQDESLRDSMYSWAGRDTYGRDATLYTAHFTKAENHRAGDAFIEKAVANIESNIIPFVAAHPETQFDFYFPPYSLAEWSNMESNGTLRALMPLRALSYDMLSAYDNVRFHDFSAKEEWIKDLNNYKDPMHHGDWINDAIVTLIAGEEHLVPSREALDAASAQIAAWAAELIDAGEWIY